MKRRLRYNLSVQKAKITKPTSGSTAGRAERWCSTFAWAGNGKVPNGSWATSRAYSRVMAMRHTIMWAAPRLCMQRALAHARRKFFQAVELNTVDQTAIAIVAQINELFALDFQVLEQGLS